MVEWWDCETGAPAIDCKRPYGNSDVSQDVCEIMGWEPDDEGEYSRKLLKKAASLHKETAEALQIILSTGSFVPGRYVSADICHREWALINI